MALGYGAAEARGTTTAEDLLAACDIGRCELLEEHS